MNHLQSAPAKTHTTAARAVAVQQPNVLLRVLLAATLLAMAMLIGNFSMAFAQDLTCTGTIGNATYENIEVPNNATCTLNGTTVTGNILVKTGAILNASGVRVDGNIQGEGAARVTVNASSRIDGNIQVKQGGIASVDNTRVVGDIQYEENTGALTATNNTVNGNIQLSKNTSGAAANIVGNRIDGDLQFDENRNVLTIRDNIVDGNLQVVKTIGASSLVNNTVAENLQCSENNPAPTGSGNVAGSAEGQCRNLTGGGGGTPNPTPIPTPNPTPVPPTKHQMIMTLIILLTGQQ